MSHFTMPASHYMTSPVITIPSTSSSIEAEATLDRHEITAVGIVDERGALVGVLSRSDLLRAASGEPGETFSVPSVPVTELMSPEPATATEDTPLAVVAKTMLKNRFHRIFITRGDEPVGVVSTRDMARAVFDDRIETPAIEIATKSIIRVSPHDSIALAVQRLDASNRHGLIVVDDGWPVGTFSQVDALQSRARDPRTEVEEVMECRILVVRPETPLHQVARRALAMNVRRVVLLDDHAIAGVVSTFDFLRAVR